MRHLAIIIAGVVMAVCGMRAENYPPVVAGL